MHISIEALTEVLEAGVSYENLHRDIVTDWQPDIGDQPWQYTENPNGSWSTSLLGIINGALEETIGMVLTAVLDDDGNFQWWCLRQVWWNKKGD